MPITRGQMKRQLRMGGGIIDIVPRDKFFLGKIAKAAKKTVKKVTGGIKDILSSDIGKAALLGFGAYKLGPMLGSNMALPEFLTSKTAKNLAIGAAGSILGGVMAKAQEGDEEAIEATRNVDSLKSYLRQGYRNLKSFVKADGTEDVEALEAQVNRDVSEYSSGAGGYAQGGRIGFAEGTYDDFEEFMKERGKAMKNFNRDRILEEFRQYMKRQDPTVEAAEGGRIEYAMGDSASDNAMQAAGIEGLPVRQNPKGVKELDLRETGGFIPPVGIKEKEDDIPAMLSNNEFVFTADAVRGMGEGDVNKGAQRMYSMMKALERGGRV
jgi:hypothetical protein